MQPEKPGTADKNVHAGRTEAALNANEDKHERYRSWVILIIWILEKLIKKGG